MAGSHDNEERSEQGLRRGGTRREFLAAGVGAVLGAAAVGAGWASSRGTTATTTTTVVPPGGGRGTGVVTDFAHATDTLDAGSVAPVLDATALGRPWYPPGGEQRLAVVSFDATSPALAAAYLEDKLPAQPNYAVVGDTALMALILRDPHCGCANQFCESSGWWESPCHHHRYNLIGEWQHGESPRGLDRYPTFVEDNRLLVGLRRTVVGPDPAAGAAGGEPAGPFCIGV